MRLFCLEILSAHEDAIQMQETRMSMLLSGATNETNNRKLHSRIVQLETGAALGLASIQNQDIRITQIESTNDVYGERIAELEIWVDSYSTENSSERLIKLESTQVSTSDAIKKHSEALTNISEQMSHIASDSVISHRVSDLELNRMSDISIIQSINNTVTILAERLAEGETNISTVTNKVKNISKAISELQFETMTSASVIQDHNNTLTYQSYRLAELATTKSEVQNNSDRINEMIFNRKSDVSLIQEYNGTLIDFDNRITLLETDKDTIKNNSDEIYKLKMERLSDISSFEKHNDTLIRLSIQMSELLSVRSAIKNNSDQITELAMNQNDRNVTLTDHETRIAELETSLSLVQNSTDMITKLHTESFDRLVALEPYCHIAINNSATVDELQLDRQSVNSMIREHNSTLQNVQSRLTAVEGKL